MLTPQEVSEHAFAKASFGGYNMAMVDEFLDQLTEDYTTLYKENAVLKSKMKVLVDKVEEYRATEDAMRKALLTAQQMADQMIQEAERKKGELIAQAEGEARDKVADLRKEVEAEQMRLTAAQNASTAYIAKLKDLCQHEMDYLTGLAQFTPPAPKAPDPVVTTAQDISASLESIVHEEAAPVPEEGDTVDLDAEKVRAAAEAERPGGLYDDIAAFARSAGGMEEKHIELTLGQKPEPSGEEKKAAPDEPTKRIDFEHLQFGKDYEIK